jgi:hypothetical protein
MRRNALVTDVLLMCSWAAVEERSHVNVSCGPRGHLLWVVNTHLESLPMGTPSCVVQLGVIAGLLKDAEAGGIVGRDMNTIGPPQAAESEYRQG